MDASDKLKRVFSEVFDLAPAQTDFETLRYRGIPQWDSVAHMQLVAALESTFDIMLETEDVIDLSSFPKARDILKKYDVAFESQS
jgi:acyl carrier protein